VGLAFAVRLVLVLVVNRVVWGDEPFYLWLGHNWFTGKGYSFTGYSDVHHTPGYPFISAVFNLLTNNLESASDLSFVIFGTLLMLPVYGLARRIYNRQVGYIALLLLAVWPALTSTILFWGTMTEPPYYFFAYAALFALLVGMERLKPWAVFLAGLAVGAAYLVRPEGVAYLAILLFYLLVIRLFEKRLFARRTVLELACLLGGFALFFMPYAVYVRLETGSWMISEKAGVTFITSWRLAYGDTVAFDKATWGLDSTGL
jgi:4-amino-4-deoxy-L-arabinose transferase-like glycosyltransferase